LNLTARRRIPIEKASTGAAPLDLQISEKEIRLSGLSLFMAVEAERVLKTSLDFGLSSSSVPFDSLLADPGAYLSRSFSHPLCKW
jgi:hypothetical protein